jgi:glycosyltransferase involved in cell wall biosynthesis
MRLDVIVPTHNRCALLERALRSLLLTALPAGLDARVVVVDNNSVDGTRSVVERLQEGAGGRLRYFFEPRLGRSHALNTGIEHTDAALVGIIDDDEEIGATWYARILTAFAESSLDFIGGPYLPRWGANPPAWLPPDYPGAIGWITAGDRERPYDQTYPGILMGGNAVFRRATLIRISPYPTYLGRTGTRLFAGEDDEMYRRLRAIGARGMYFPDLSIHHYIPPERLTKRYYRRWCFWRAVSWSMVDRRRPENVTYLFGVPRYLYGKAARGFLTVLKSPVERTPQDAVFSAELKIWDLVGFMYGRHVYQLLHRETRGA